MVEPHTTPNAAHRSPSAQAPHEIGQRPIVGDLRKAVQEANLRRAFGREPNGLLALLLGNKKLLGAKGIASSNKCLTSSNKKLQGAPGLTSRN